MWLSIVPLLLEYVSSVSQSLHLTLLSEICSKRDQMTHFLLRSLESVLRNVSLIFPMYTSKCLCYQQSWSRNISQVHMHLTLLWIWTWEIFHNRVKCIIILDSNTFLCFTELVCCIGPLKYSQSANPAFRSSWLVQPRQKIFESEIIAYLTLVFPYYNLT